MQTYTTVNGRHYVDGSLWDYEGWKQKQELKNVMRKVNEEQAFHEKPELTEEKVMQALSMFENKIKVYKAKDKTKAQFKYREEIAQKFSDISATQGIQDLMKLITTSDHTWAAVKMDGLAYCVTDKFFMALNTGDDVLNHEVAYVVQRILGTTNSRISDLEVKYNLEGK